MTAAPILPPAGGHVGSHGATVAAGDKVSAAQWSAALAQAGAAAPAPRPDVRFRGVAAGQKTHTLVAAKSASTESSPEHTHGARHADAQPASAGSQGHHRKDDATGGAVAIMNAAVIAAPVADGKTVAARDTAKTDTSRHDAPASPSSGKAMDSGRPEEAPPATTAATMAATNPDTAQGNDGRVGEDRKSDDGVMKPSFPGGGNPVTAETSNAVSILPPAKPVAARVAEFVARPDETASARSAAPPQPVADMKNYDFAAPKKLSGAAGASAPGDAAAQGETKPPAAVPPSTASVADATVPGMGAPEAQPPGPPAPFSAGAPVPATPSALAAAVVAMHKSGDASTILRLDPAGLGALTIHVSIGDGARINVQFTPAVAQTAHIINSNLDDLRQAMTAAGLSLGQSFVSTGGGQTGGGSGDNRQAPQGRQYGETRAEQPDSSAASELNHPAGMVSAYA